MENPIKMDDLGGKPTIFGNIHIYFRWMSFEPINSPTVWYLLDLDQRIIEATQGFATFPIDNMYVGDLGVCGEIFCDLFPRFNL